MDEKIYHANANQTQAGVTSLACTVKNLSAMWETWVQSLGYQDPL